MPRLGKIHLGIKALNDKGVEYPRAVDYFVCPPEVQAVSGEKPKELRILIPVEDEEKWASQYYRLYSRTRGLICKGDGEKAMRLVDAMTGDLTWKDEAKEVVMREVVCKGRECQDYGIRCKEIMNLQFLLPEVPGLGVWQIDTGSVNSILNINAGGDFIRRLYGRISLIPLLLTVEPQEVKTPEGKKKTVWVLNLRTRETLGNLMQLSQLKTAELLALPEPEETEMPVPDDETPELIIPVNQQPKEGEKPPPQTESDKAFDALAKADSLQDSKTGETVKPPGKLPGDQKSIPDFKKPTEFANWWMSQGFTWLEIMAALSIKKLNDLAGKDLSAASAMLAKIKAGRDATKPNP